MHKTSTRSLPCIVTPEEKRLYAEMCAREVENVRQVERDKKTAMADFKAIIDERKAELVRLSEIVNTGKEYREIECFERKNMIEGIMETIRGDTEEIIESRPLEPKEKQASMDFAD